MATARARGQRRRWRRQPARETWSSRALAVATLERATLPGRAARLIRNRILAGDVRPGQRLQSLRALATELGVSLPTAREAIAELRGEGLIEVRHGIGCFVTRRPRAARTLKATIRHAARREVAEMRVVVDPAVANMAAVRATPSGLRALVSATWDLRAARRSGDPDAFIDADLDFHHKVASAARGPIGVAAHGSAPWCCAPGFARARPRLRTTSASRTCMTGSPTPSSGGDRPGRRGPRGRSR